MTADRRAAFWIAGLALFVAALYVLRDVLLPFLVGLGLAYLLDPVVRALARRRVPRGLAAALITGLSVLSVIAAFLVLVPLLQKQVIDFAREVPAYMDIVSDRAMRLAQLLQAELSPEEMTALRERIGGLAGPDAIAWIGKALGGLWDGGMALLNLLSLLVITPIVTFYMLRDWDRIVATVDGWLPRRSADTVREQVRRIDAVLSGFVRGQFVVCLMLGVFYAAGLILVGLRFGLVIGLLTGLISFVPYFGMAVGFALGIGVAVVQFSDWEPVAMVAGVFIVGQLIESYFVTPRIVGNRIGLHPVWLIFALLAGGALAGFTGVLLAVPVAAATGVLVRFAVQGYRESELYDDPAGRGEGGPVP